MEKEISILIADAETQTDAQILCILATRASHYPTVPWVYATLIALFLPFILYFLTNLDYVVIYNLQLLSFALVFALLQNEALRLRLTPRFHKTARLKQRVKDVLQTQLQLNPSLKLVVIMVAEKERLCVIQSNLPLDLAPALMALTAKLGENKAQVIDAALAVMREDLQRLAPKTKASRVQFPNVIGA